MARTLELRDHPHRDGLAWVVVHDDHGTILPTDSSHEITEALRDATHAGARIGWDDRNLTTCGTCGGVWDDALISEITPVPSGRCPFETDHAAVPA